MIRMRFLLSAAFIIALICAACDDDPPPTGGVPPYLIERFPSEVGMLWKYKVVDSLTGQTDTVWVSVTEARPSVAIISIFQWRELNLRTGEVRDLVLSVMGSFVTFSTDTTQGEPEILERFIFPFENGSVWHDPYDVDTSRVSFWRSIDVPAGHFETVAEVDRVWNRDFEGGYWHSKTWLSEEAGILKRHFQRYISDGAHLILTQNETWELIEYDLTPFHVHDLPSQVWSWLQYEMVDSVSDITDTITATLVNWILLTRYDSAQVWEYNGREYSDTHFVAVDGDRAVFMLDTLGLMPFVSWAYDFPLTVGKDWGFDYIVPYPAVWDKQPVSTPAGDFPTGFLYTDAGGAFNDYWGVQDWLVPGIGFARRRYQYQSLGPPITVQLWTLIDYDVKPVLR